MDTGKEEQSISVPERVRVLLTQDNGENPYRHHVYIKGSSGLDLQTEDQEWEEPPERVIDCARILEEKNVGFLKAAALEKGGICLCEEDGSAASSIYPDTLVIYEENSLLWVVNELDMQSYLCGVVPGEMPESFEEEALKAQAVCARTYACNQAAGPSFEEYHADLTDTTASQVYLPEKKNDKCTRAVSETAGRILLNGHRPADVYYYSTSCGLTSGMEVWNTQDIPWLHPVSLLRDRKWPDPDQMDEFLRDQTVEAFDSESRFFRWSAVTDLSGKETAVRDAIQKEGGKDAARLSVCGPDGRAGAAVSTLSKIRDISVDKRAGSGAVTDLALVFENGMVHIYNENAIRTILGAAMTELKDKNGNSVHTLNILPSASFSVEKSRDGRILLYGGGLGHGIGMSQYGADGMAKQGMTWEQILKTFFPELDISEEKKVS